MSASISRARTVAVDGAELFVCEDGDRDRPGLLLLSQANANTGMWDPVLPALVERFHVVRHDVRGSGRSRAHPDARRDLDQLADDARAVLDILGIERSAVWATAFGSRVALALAARHPQRVSHLLLCDASVEPPDVSRQRQSVELARRERARRGIAEAERQPAWFEHDDDASRIRTLRAAYAAADHARYPPLIRAPALVATGELDPNLQPSRRLASALGDARFEMVAAAGHGVVVERSDVCLSLFDALVATEQSG